MATILVIDDEPSIRLLYEDLFTEAGHDVITAESGLEGIQVLEQQKVDLIVLDIRLKSASGLDVLRHIIQQNCDLPVIISSAFRSFQNDPTSQLADRYVLKSGNPEELLQHVHELLGEKREVSTIGQGTIVH